MVWEKKTGSPTNYGKMGRESNGKIREGYLKGQKTKPMSTGDTEGE